MPLYCRKCGTHLSPDSQFCPACGTSQSLTDYSLTSQFLNGPAGTGRLATGKLLHQRYRVLRVVGKGGMGAVYLAQDTQLGDRLVAVKEMSMSRLAPRDVPQAIQQFQTDALVNCVSSGGRAFAGLVAGQTNRSPMNITTRRRTVAPTYVNDGGRLAGRI